MTFATSSFIPFLTSLSGLSRFDDLNAKLRALKLSDPAELNVIFVSFYDDLVRGFNKYADIHFFKRNKGNVIIVRENHLFKLKKDIDSAIEGRRCTFAFDSASTTETLSLIIRALEKGHEINVFHPWVHKGKEKRSAFSVLLRSCGRNNFSISPGEMEMWSTYALQRVKPLEVNQSFEFI
jgi:hypothetical protein